MTLMDFVAIDFEASCLPRHGRSYPIEVGIAGTAGARSWLIKPDPRWQDWDWTGEAFGLHGITREQLNDEGIAPERVFAELRRAVSGKRVVADSMIDSYWWDTLAAVTPYRHASPIEHASNVLGEWGVTSDMISAACDEAERLCPARHRAVADARWLWTLLSFANEQLEPASETAVWQWSPGRSGVGRQSAAYAEARL
jgi:hypothetical protein